MDLTIEELEILIRGIDAWEQSDRRSALTVGMIGSMLAKDKDEEKTRMEDVMREADKKTKTKAEIAICLKAKLVLMKNRLNERVESPSAKKEVSQGGL